MEEGMTLTKLGLFECRWNGDRVRAHKRRKKDGKCVIINRESGEVVYSADTPEEADDFFYDNGPVNNIFAALRNRITLEKGLTLRDLIDFIRNREELYLFTMAALPLFDFQLQREEPSSLPSDPFVVGREGYLGLDGVLTIAPNNSFTIPHADWDVPLELDEEFSIYDDGKVILHGTLCFTFLELLQNLFSTNPDEMATVHLTKNGVCGDDGVVLDPLRHILNPCVIEDNFSLRDLFDLMDSHEALKCFVAQYSWCRSIDEFHAAAKLPAEPTTLKFLKITKRGEVHAYDGERDIGLDCDVHGHGPLSDQEKEEWMKYGVQDEDGKPKSPPQFQDYGIGFSPMSQLADLSLATDDTLEIHEYKADLVTCGRQPFALLEIIDAVYWEISFYGGPEEAHAMCEDLKQRVEDVKSGVEKTIPFDEVKADLDREFGYKKEVNEPDDDDPPRKQFQSVDEMFAEFDEEAEYRIDANDPRDD